VADARRRVAGLRAQGGCESTPRRLALDEGNTEEALERSREALEGAQIHEARRGGGRMASTGGDLHDTPQWQESEGITLKAASIRGAAWPLGRGAIDSQRRVRRSVECRFRSPHLKSGSPTTAWTRTCGSMARGTHNFPLGGEPLPLSEELAVPAGALRSKSAWMDEGAIRLCMHLARARLRTAPRLHRESSRVRRGDPGCGRFGDLWQMIGARREKVSGRPLCRNFRSGDRAVAAERARRLGRDRRP